MPDLRTHQCEGGGSLSKPTPRKIYSDVIELTPWEFCEDALLPGPLLLHACNMQIKAFSYYYWNMFNRIKDKQVTFEVPLINVDIYDHPVDFLNERRLLFQTEINTVYDNAMLQVRTGVFKAADPFTPVAQCVWNGVECMHRDPDDWALGSFDEPPQINTELANLLLPADEVLTQNPTLVLKRLDAAGQWIGKSNIRHRILHPHCEYGFMGAFMNYTGPILSSGKDALLNHAQQCGLPIPSYIKKKTDYRGWKMWYSIKKAFFYDDTIEVISSHLHAGGKDYIKHELYSVLPHLLRSIIIEEYTPIGEENPA